MKESDVNFSRRSFLGVAGTAAATTALATGSPLRAATAATPALPAAGASGIDHIIVVMMENRSFDHFLGWMPGADGKQAGLSYTDRYGIPHATHHLTDFQGCGHPDPDHSYEGGRIQYNDGKNNGWLRAGENDEFAVGYYDAADLDFWRQAGAGLDGLRPVLRRHDGRNLPEPVLPARGRHRPAAQLHRDLHAPDHLGPAGRRRSRPASTTTATSRSPRSGARSTSASRTTTPSSSPMPPPAACPAVSFVDPRFTDEGSGTSGDDHPHADIRSGETFLAEVYNAVTTSPGWANTLLVINYDEWGGFYDHVAPGTAPDVERRRRPCAASGSRPW